jgi:hypothetical protein
MRLMIEVGWEAVLTMSIARVIAVAVVPPIKRGELFGSRVLLGSPHRVELLGGPRCVFNRVDDVPTIDHALFVGLKKPVGVRDGRVWFLSYFEQGDWTRYGMYVCGVKKTRLEDERWKEEKERTHWWPWGVCHGHSRAACWVTAELNEGWLINGGGSGKLNDDKLDEDGLDGIENIATC